MRGLEERVKHCHVDEVIGAWLVEYMHVHAIRS